MTRGPLAPHYGGGALDSVLPTIAAALGSRTYADRLTGSSTAGEAPSRRAVVVLVDGLGDDLLRRRSGHAPFLRGLLGSGRRIDAGYPTTTATSMGTFGTGLAPGAHGMVGYEVLDPMTDRILNELSWDNGPDPLAWQPSATVFETLAAEGVSVTRVGPGYFDGSGLTNAALRGGRFVAADTLAARVEATLAALRTGSRSLVYLYWGELDRTGHVHGCDSWQWGEELESVDRELAALAQRLPTDTALHIVADHGMVDVPFADRVDLADTPELDAGLRHLGGEPRSPQLYCQEGAVADVLTAWTERFAEQAWVLEREEAVAAGWFGEVRPENLPRIGDIIVAFHGSRATVDRRRMRPVLLELLGLHGSLTSQELAVPWLVLPARTG